MSAFRPAEWMAPTKDCARADALDVDLLDHHHFVSSFVDRSLASVVCRVELPLTEDFMEEVDASRELIFTKPGIDTMIQAGANAGLTINLCSNWDINWGNAMLAHPSTYREDGKPFQAVSVAHNVYVPTLDNGNALLKAIDRYCWGTLEQKGRTYEFDPSIHRATIVGAFIGSEVLTTIIEPAKGILADERSLPNKYLLGQVVNTQIAEDPYTATLSLLERIAEYDPLSRD